MLIGKMHNRWKDKINVYETDSKTSSYKHKEKKAKYYDSESSSEVNARSRKGRCKYISDGSESDHKPKIMNYKPYEEISREFRKINPPMFKGEVEKGEEAEACLWGMKKYFHIYNYFDKIKARMAIYNLNIKADI